VPERSGAMLSAILQSTFSPLLSAFHLLTTRRKLVNVYVEGAQTRPDAQPRKDRQQANTFWKARGISCAVADGVFMRPNEKELSHR
jgi:hypothetical protein